MGVLFKSCSNISQNKQVQCLTLILNKPAEYTHIGRPVPTGRPIPDALGRPVTVGLRVREVSGLLPQFVGFPVPVGGPVVRRPVGVGLRIRGVSSVFQCFIGFPALIGHPVIGCPVSVGRPVPDVFFCACSVLVSVRCKPDVGYACTGRPVRTGRPILMQAE